MKMNKEILFLIALATFGVAPAKAVNTINPDTIVIDPVTQCANAYTASGTCVNGCDPTQTVTLTGPARQSEAEAIAALNSACIDYSFTGSKIDNITLNHFHDAIDYSSSTSGASGCSSCSAGAGGLPQDASVKVGIKRTQSLRDVTQPSSFGRGNFMGYDITLTLFDYNGVSYVDAFNVEWNGARRFSPSGSTFVDAIYYSTKSFALYDASGNLTTTRSNAVRAVHVDRDGNRMNFDLFPLDANRTGGRLVSVSKPDGQDVLNFTYAATIGDTTVDPATKWQKATATDLTGATLQFNWSTLATGTSVISAITTPTGNIAYEYDAGGNLTKVTLPNGDISTFTRSGTAGRMTMTIAEAGARGMHRNKTALYSNIIDSGVFWDNNTRPAVYNQSSGLVRAIMNGSGEATFASAVSNWNYRKVYEGGGRLKSVDVAWKSACTAWSGTSAFQYNSITATNEAYGTNTRGPSSYAETRAGIPQALTVPEGFVHYFKYDANRNVTSETVGTSSKFIANDVRFNNKPTFYADFSGKAFIAAYDAAGNMVSRTKGWARDNALGAGVRIPGVKCSSSNGTVSANPNLAPIPGASLYTTTLTVDTAGPRSFYLTSGYFRTHLYVDGAWLLHPYYTQGEYGISVNLTAGTHEIVVKVDDGTDFKLLWAGPETTGADGIVRKSAIDPQYLSHLTAANELVVHDTPAASTETWTYYAAGTPQAGLMQTHTDSVGKVTRYTYDATRHLTQIQETGDDGSLVTVRTMTYDAVGNKVTETDAMGRSLAYAYDARNRLVKTTYGDNTTETIAYGTGVDANLVVATKDRAGSVTKFEYDAAGRKVKTTAGYALADNTGAITQVLTNPSVETYTYLDGTEDAIRVVRDGKVTEYDYDYKGRVIATRRFPSQGKSLASATLISPDELRFSETDPHGCRSFYAYRATDKKLVREIRELVPGSLGTLADNAAVLAVTRDTAPNPGYAITDYTLDNDGRTIAETDPRGIQTTTAYDAKGRVISKTYAAGTTNAQTMTMGYDAADRVVAQADALNRTTSRAYTPAGRMASVVYPDSKHEDFTYYADGKLATRKDADGFTSNMTWSQCCGREFGAANPKGEGTLKFYDGPGRVTYQVLVKDVAAASGFVNWTSGITFPSEAVVSAQTMKYDARGRLVASTKWNTVPANVQPHNPPIAPANSTDGFTTTYEYFDDLSDSRFAPVLSQLASQGITLAAGSATIVTNPAGEHTFSVSDGAGRTVYSGAFAK